MYSFTWLWQLAVVLWPLKILLNLKPCPVDKADLVSGKVSQTAKLQMQTDLCLLPSSLLTCFAMTAAIAAAWQWPDSAT